MLKHVFFFGNFEGISFEELVVHEVWVGVICMYIMTDRVNLFLVG